MLAIIVATTADLVAQNRMQRRKAGQMDIGLGIGRVGALAVALGVGMAIAAVPGIATAETDSGATSSNPPKSASVGAPTTSSQRVGAPNKTHTPAKRRPGPRGAGSAPKGHDDDSPSSRPVVNSTASTPSRDGSAAPRPAAASAAARKSSAAAAPPAPSPVVAGGANIDRLAVSHYNTSLTTTTPLTNLSAGTLTVGPTAPMDTPLVPLDSAAQLGLLAWTRRQQTQTAATTVAATAAVRPLTAVAVTAPPTASPTQTSPNPTTGVVTGSINGTDTAGNTLSYKLSGQTASSGAVVVDAATGAFTYTPSLAGRVLAGLAGGATKDTFTVAVSNASTSTSVTVTVPVLPATIVPSATPTTVGTGPVALAVSGTKVYAANSGSSTLSVIDRTTGAVTSIPVVGSPSAIALSSDGSRAYVAGNGAVSVVNLTTNSVVATVNTGGGTAYGIALSANGQRLYTSNSGTNSVTVIDTSTATPKVLSTISVGKSPRAMALSADGTRLYVANWNSKSVSVVDTGTNKTVASIAVGSNPFGVAVSADGRQVYVTNNGSNSVSVVDTVAARSVSTIQMGSKPLGLALSPDGTMLFAANATDTVSVINISTNRVVGALTIDSAPESNWHGIAFGPDGRQLYVSDMADNAVRVLNLNSPPVAGVPTVGTPDPASGAVSGTLNFVDPNNNSLTYSITQPTAGVVTVTSAGNYTFTPTSVARIAAGQADGAKTAVFAVTASDGSLSATVSVSVPILATTTPTTPTVPEFNSATWLWNAISGGAVLNTNSAAWAAAISGGQHVFDINAYSVSVVEASQVTANTPRYTIQFTNAPAWGPSPFGTYQVPIPLGTPVPTGSDGHLVVVDPVTNMVFGLWQAKYNATSNTWSASWGGMTSLTGNGIDTSGSATATGFSRLAGIVMADEFSAAAANNTGLNHALFFSSSFAANSYVYPAVKSDALASTPLIPQGTRFILDPSINVDAIPGITAGEKVIAKTLQTYGGYIGDAGGAPLALIGQLDPGNAAYTGAGIAWDYYNMSHIPWTSLQFLATWNGASPA